MVIYIYILYISKSPKCETQLMWSIFSLKKKGWLTKVVAWILFSEIFRDPPPNDGTPWAPYYSHTTPIRIPKDMGMVWVQLTIRGKSPLIKIWIPKLHMCHSRSTPCIGDGKPPTFNDGNPYNGYINPYYWVDDHPLLYGNHGSLDPSTYRKFPKKSWDLRAGTGDPFRTAAKKQGEETPLYPPWN